MTERLHFHFHFSLSCIGEGNGNPLQCSCLENSRDGKAWWAAIYGVTQNQTRLKRLSSSSSSIRQLLRSSQSHVEDPQYRPNLPFHSRVVLPIVLAQALVKCKVKVSQSCPNLSNPMVYTVHGILQARILEWVAFPFSRGSSQPKDRTQVSHKAGRFFTS